MHDVILVGGGLANCLIAFRLKNRRPDTSVLIVEESDSLGGNHTWSFHGTDLDEIQRTWMAPFIAHAWPGQDVSFPSFARSLAIRYCSVTSARLRAVMGGIPGLDLLFGRRVADLSATGIVLEGGQSIAARAVIDGRGVGALPSLTIRFQKFHGLEVALNEPHGMDRPRLMDGTVEQVDGFRFMYVLPLDPTRLLIEDTYFADTPTLDLDVIRRQIMSYARKAGWSISHVVREETGALPIVLDGDIADLWSRVPAGVACAGVRAALFHPTTGYSLPDAVRLADAVAAAPDVSGAGLAQLTRAESAAHWTRHGYSRLLNRLLFIAARPAERRGVMRRFYTLPEGMIARFYAGRTTRYDRVRILTGRPPVNILRAIGSLPRSAARKAAKVVAR